MKTCTIHRRSQGEAKEAMPPLKFLENIVILCFERPFSKQNSVIRLKSNIVPPPKFLGHWYDPLYFAADQLLVNSFNCTFCYGSLVEGVVL